MHSCVGTPVPHAETGYCSKPLVRVRVSIVMTMTVLVAMTFVMVRAHQGRENRREQGKHQRLHRCHLEISADHRKAALTGAILYIDSTAGSNVGFGTLCNI